MQDKLLDDWRYRFGVPDKHMFITELSRYKLYNPAKVSLSNGDNIVLIRRPRNADDPNAIEVMKQSGKISLGFLPREISEVLAPVIDKHPEEVDAYFHADSDVASGMIVIAGDGIGRILPELQAISDDPHNDTSIHIKERTEDINIEWYNRNAELYDKNANRCNPRNDLSTFLSQIPSGGKVLDAGCGNGRDMETFQKMGYEVAGFDASKEMCRISRARLNGDADVRHMRFSEFVDEPGTWDGIWAMASLVHTDPRELPDVVESLRRSLKPGGTLFAALKYGESNDIAPDGRRMMRFNEDTIREAFIGSGDLRISKREALNSAGEKDIWLNIMFTKAPDLYPEVNREAEEEEYYYS